MAGLQVLLLLLLLGMSVTRRLVYRARRCRELRALAGKLLPEREM